jgi:twitching motility protein PilU
MKTFDQALFDLHEEELITYDEALRNADSMNELRLRIKLEGKAATSGDMTVGLEHLNLVNDDERSGMMR